MTSIKLYTSKQANFEDIVTNHQKKNSFKIQADENVILNLAFSNRRHKAKLIRAQSEQPEYFLNFEFNNYRNPKQPKEDSGNQKGYKNSNIKFPLKDEDTFSAS